MKKSMVIIAIMAMTISLTGCFPTEKDNYNSKNQRAAKVVSINDLKNIKKHITEDIMNNLKVDADISICIGDKASVYSAESMNIEYDKEWIG